MYVFIFLVKGLWFIIYHFRVFVVFHFCGVEGAGQEKGGNALTVMVCLFFS